MDKQQVNGILDIGSTLLEPGSRLDQCSAVASAAVADGASGGGGSDDLDLDPDLCALILPLLHCQHQLQLFPVSLVAGVAGRCGWSRQVGVHYTL